jgi:hypothetical protein
VGSFYFIKAGPVNPGGGGFGRITPHNGSLLRVSKDGSKLDVVATGFRAPNGMGMGPNGEMTSGDNQGTWTPVCRLNWVREGGFYGVVDLAHRDTPPKQTDNPLCWLPTGVDNSAGGQTWVTSDKWGPLAGHLLHTSYGQSSLLSVLYEDAGGDVQGGVVRFPLTFDSGVMRPRFNPKDGQLYVCGMKGWQTNAAKDACFQRVRYTGKPANMPTGAYRIDAYMVDGTRVTLGAQKILQVGQVGFSAQVYLFAHEHAWPYSMLAISMALFAGWGAFTFLRRD